MYWELPSAPSWERIFSDLTSSMIASRLCREHVIANMENLTIVAWSMGSTMGRQYSTYEQSRGNDLTVGDIRHMV